MDPIVHTVTQRPYVFVFMAVYVGLALRDFGSAADRALHGLGLRGGVDGVDPLALRGERWFLGPIVYSPEGGPFFGVPLSNFAGWFLVGWLTLGGFAPAVRTAPPSRRSSGSGRSCTFRSCSCSGAAML